MPKDQIYATAHTNPGSFQFDSQVANVFEDMISRSVPGYGLSLDMIGVIARQYGQPDTRCYDLGCSLGASTLALRHNVPVDCEVIAIDNSAAMIEQCQANLDADSGGSATPLPPVTLQCQDNLETPIENASVAVMNFTLQFIEPVKRDDLLKRIAAGMCNGGAFVLSEKLAFTDQLEQTTLMDLHHGFKRAKGYSDLEIAQKRSAIENVLIPETLITHQQRLLDAGFSRVMVWFQCFNFVSLLALK